MIVTDGTSGGFPDMLLGIEVRRGHREEHDFQTGIGRQELTERLTTMPGRAVPQKQNGAVGKSIEDGLQMMGAGFSIHDRFATGDDLASVQVERAVEVGLGTALVGTDEGCLTTWCPDAVRGGLQVEGGFVLGQNECVGRILQQVDQFFSSCSSKAATCVSRRDLNTLAGR